jgi:hypothetical protein
MTLPISAWPAALVAELGRHASELAHATANLSLVAELQANAKSPVDQTLLAGLRSLRLRAAMLARALPSRSTEPARATTLKLVVEAWTHTTAIDVRDAGCSLTVDCHSRPTLSWQEPLPLAFFLIDAVVRELVANGAKTVVIGVTDDGRDVTFAVDSDARDAAPLEVWRDIAAEQGLSGKDGMFSITLPL